MIPLDDALRDAVKSLPFARFRDSKLGSFKWYYAEDEVYVVQRETGDGGGLYLIVKASNPDEAIRKAAKWSGEKPRHPDPRRILGSALRDTFVDCGECGDECPRRSDEGVSMYDCPKFATMKDAADGKDDDDDDMTDDTKEEKKETHT